MKSYKELCNSIYKRIGSTIYYKYPRWRHYMPDKMYLQCIWRDTMGYELDFNHPRTFNEKLQWLKVYNKKPIYTKMVDKATAKEYAALIIGEEYIIPTLGIYKTFDEIDFDKLPNQFVLKSTHDSGGVYICKDKNKIDLEKARSQTEGRFWVNVYNNFREWPYKNVKPRIIAEVYMEDETFHELRDYKFFCFDGVVKALFIASDRMCEREETKFDFFDENFNHLPFTNGHPNAKVLPQKPVCFDEMKMLASKLSENIPHVRVDFYEVNGKVYFGELTFFHWTGLTPFVPKEWDYRFGSYIKLPIDK